MRASRFLLAGAAWIGLVLPASAQDAPSASTSVVAPDDATLRESLLSAQQEIVRLRAQVADQQDLEVALKAAREKNERLVGIADALIAGYQKRYQRGQFLPFDTGRRKFEAELQDLGDRAYDNHWNAIPKRSVAAPEPLP